jgi:hypothetical protein
MSNDENNEQKPELNDTVFVLGDGGSINVFILYIVSCSLML